MRRTIELYKINAAFNKAFILCILHMKGFMLLKKIRHQCYNNVRGPFSPLPGDIGNFLGTQQNANQIKRGGRVVGLNVIEYNTESRRLLFRPFAIQILLSPCFGYVHPAGHKNANRLSSKCEFLI